MTLKTDDVACLSSAMITLVRAKTTAQLQMSAVGLSSHTALICFLVVITLFYDINKISMGHRGLKTKQS